MLLQMSTDLAENGCVFLVLAFRYRKVCALMSTMSYSFLHAIGFRAMHDLTRYRTWRHLDVLSDLLPTQGGLARRSSERELINGRLWVAPGHSQPAFYVIWLFGDI
jgi:hypothetical protein